MVTSFDGHNIYYIKKKFTEIYPQILKYTGEPSLYSFDSVTQWLLNVIGLPPESFSLAGPIVVGCEKIPKGRPWCHVLFCTNRVKQEISTTLFDSIGFKDGITVKIYHGIQYWNVSIKDKSFSEGWEAYCVDNLVHEHDMLFLRTKGNLSYDSMAFSSSQSHSIMRWTLPLPMLPQPNLHSQDDSTKQLNLTFIASSINQFFKHDWASFASFYQFYTPGSRHRLALPQYANLQLHEKNTPTIILTSGSKTYAIGMKERSLEQNWNVFVADHDLHAGEILLFIPQSGNSFAVVVFNRKGIEKLFPWHFSFTIHLG